MCFAVAGKKNASNLRVSKAFVIVLSLSFLYKYRAIDEKVRAAMAPTVVREGTGILDIVYSILVIILFRVIVDQTRLELYQQIN